MYKEKGNTRQKKQKSYHFIMVLCCWYAIVLVPASQLQDHALSTGVISRSERDEICTAPFYISFSQLLQYRCTVPL